MGLLATCVLSGCGVMMYRTGDGLPSTDGGGSLVGIPAQIVVVSGNAQTALPSAALPDSVVVKVVDFTTAAVANITVHFSVTSGGGSVDSFTVVTDGAGLATVNWTLGSSLGVQTLAAFSSGVPTVDLTATAALNPPTGLAKVSGDAQTAQVGQTLTNPLVVQVTDASANPLSGITVNFAVTSGGGTPSVSSAVTDASGNAQVSWTLGTIAGSAQVLRASVSGVPTVDFTATATIGPATHLTFSTEPSSSATAGADLATQPIIQVQDAYGNVITTSAAAIALAAYTDSGCTFAATGTLSGGSMNAVNGVAAFAGVDYQKAETIYLKATTAGLTADCSNAIAVSPAAASTIVFSTQPSATATAGSAFSTQPVVQVRDAYANVVTSSSASITLAAYTDVGCTSASGTALSGSGNPLSASSGVASFSGISYSSIGTLYLRASGAGFTACSDAIVVSAGAATQLVLTLDQWWVRPSTCSQPIRIRFKDSSGNFTTAGSALTVSLTDNILPNDASASATGRFYTDAACATSAVTSIAFASGDTQKVLYYSDTASETVKIRATQASLTAASERMTVAAASGFASALTYAAQSFVSSAGVNTVGIGDFNGDGKNDVVAANYDNDSFSAFFQQSDGTLGGRVDVSTVDGAISLAVAFLGGPTDTVPDVIVSGQIDDAIKVHRGNGDGTFQAALTLANSSMQRITTGDVNGDGYADIVAAKQDGKIDVYVNNTAGGFAAKVAYSTSTTEANDVTLADFDGDGDLDAAIVSYPDSMVKVLRNNGAGVFGSAYALFDGATRTTALVNHFEIASGFFNGDALADVVYTAYNGVTNRLAVALSAGDGTDATAGTVDDFAAESSVSDVGTSPFRPAVYDVDGDADPDLVVPSNGLSRIYVLLNNGSGAFTVSTYYSVQSGGGGLPRAVAVGDLNSDGEADIVSANANSSTISVFYGVP